MSIEKTWKRAAAGGSRENSSDECPKGAGRALPGRFGWVNTPKSDGCNGLLRIVTDCYTPKGKIFAPPGSTSNQRKGQISNGECEPIETPREAVTACHALSRLVTAFAEKSFLKTNQPD